MDDQQTPTGEAPTLDAAQRKALKAQAHPLKPVVMIGDAGLSPSVLAEIERALVSHELIKIRVLGDDREARVSLLAAICAQTGSAPVQHIGKLLVVWRPLADGEQGAAETPKKRRKPNLPYQPKKAAGAGQAAPTRRVPRERDAAPARPADSDTGPRSSEWRDKPGARNGERPTPLGRGAAIGKTGTRAATAHTTTSKSGVTAKPAARKQYGAPISTDRPARPGRAPLLASPGARIKSTSGRKR
jgi:RNA-binding protein